MRWSDRRAAAVFAQRQVQARAVPLPEAARAAPACLEASQPLAIGPPREIHLHLNVTPDQLAAIVRHHTEEDL